MTKIRGFYIESSQQTINYRHTYFLFTASYPWLYLGVPCKERLRKGNSHYDDRNG